MILLPAYDRLLAAEPALHQYEWRRRCLDPEDRARLNFRWCPCKHDVSTIRAMFVGGSAVPQALIQAFEQRYGLKIFQAWGMTEMAPLGSVAQMPIALANEPDEVKFQYRARQQP